MVGDENNEDEEVEIEIREGPKEEIIESKQSEMPEEELEEIIQEPTSNYPFFRPPSLQASEPMQQETAMPLEVQMQNVPKKTSEEEQREADLSRNYDSSSGDYDSGRDYEAAGDNSGYPEQVRATSPSMGSNIDQFSSQPQTGGYPSNTNKSSKQYQSSIEQDKAARERQKKKMY